MNFKEAFLEESRGQSEQTLLGDTSFWCQYFDAEVIDADGWRHEGIAATTQITAKDFARLWAQSTCRQPPSKDLLAVLNSLNDETNQRSPDMPADYANSDFWCTYFGIARDNSLKDPLGWQRENVRWNDEITAKKFAYLYSQSGITSLAPPKLKKLIDDNDLDALWLSDVRDPTSKKTPDTSKQEAIKDLIVKAKNKREQLIATRNDINLKVAHWDGVIQLLTEELG